MGNDEKVTIIWRLILAGVFVLLAVAWGGGWGLVTGPLRWVGLVVFAALAVINLMLAAGRRPSRGRPPDDET